MARLTIIVHESNFIVAHEPAFHSEHLWELPVCGGGKCIHPKDIISQNPNIYR